ncbi:MAG: CotH kinase family protein, partial [Firmicutes bacterium]|nr:CotH kinase family protein [Bacillota bacterium]
FTVVPDSDIRLDAKWVAAATISFATGVPGLTVAPIKAPVGSDVKKPKDPVRTDGYLFDGWLLSGEPYKFTVIPSRDITLTAKWTASCTITFNADADDIEVPALVQVPGRSIKPPDAPLRAGFYLEGWYRPDGKRFIFNVMPSASVTLKAKWVETSKLPTVTVTLHNEDGSIISIEDTRFAPTPWSAGWPNTDTKPQVRYLDCTYGITNSKGEPEFISGVIKPKGNGSFRANPYVRRPYRVKLDQKTSFFGWPKSKQYTLAAVSHNNNDPSRLVTHSGYALARSEALPGIEFGARSQPVDLYINGVYRGVYVFTETVKVEEGRLEIESEYAGIHAGTSADPYVTDTGYLLFFGSDQHTVIGEDPRAVFKISGVGQSFLMESPHVDDVDDPEIPEATGAGYRAQREYITGQTQNLYNMMTAANYNEFLRVADIDSFVDGYILQELYRNEDIDSGGYYLYKKSPAQGGKWYAGPPWDLDCTTKDGGIEGITVGPGGGWGNNPFITRLYNIPAFLTRVKARWAEVSGDVKEFITNAFNEYINDPGYAAAFRRGAGGDTGIHANAGYSSVASSNWVSIAEGKRNWLIARAGWLDGAWG